MAPFPCVRRYNSEIRSSSGMTMKLPLRTKDSALTGGEHRERAPATDADAVFDDLIDLACQTAQAPLAAVSLVQDGRHWFLSRGGLSAEEERGAMALCSETIRERLPLVLPDTAQDERFRNDPFVRSGIRFYAGFPLLTVDESKRGVLSVFDRVPRVLDESQRDALQALARQGAADFEARLANRPAPSEAASASTEIRFRPFVEEAAVGLCLIQDGRYRYVNPKLAAIFGYSPEELLGLESTLDLVVAEDRPAVRDDIWKLLEGKLPTVHYTFTAVRKDEERIHLEAYATATEFEGRPAVLGTLLDITDRKRAEARIVEQAYKDPLTNLSNRVRFMERLRQQLAEARRQNRRFAIVYLDLDRFKIINDTWGHCAGDIFLQSLALRLRRRVREVDTVARVGGDQFVILMADIRQTENLSTIAQKVLAIVARPVDVEGKMLEVTASIGIASFPEDGDDPEILLQNADTAMSRAKELGRNGFQLCTAELTSRAVARISLASALRTAVNRKELVVHYQPIVSLMTGRITGLEALVRWHSAEKGLILPADFIPIAEETGLILSVGDHVLRTACRKLKEWQLDWLPDLRVAVNVSARQFRDPSLLPTIDRALSESGLSPEYLEVEITESIAMESAEIVVGNLEALRGRGVRIAIDDFGTGYSSLNYLKRFPVHSLKIDRSFVTEVGTNPADAGIVRAVVEMAHGLKLITVAEGVETRDQFLHLQRFGCDEMQGYWVSPPLTAEGIDEILARELELWVKPT
jgi:diguanylate cyclase (GGDEF)-like protein/PAS domain S-box-containing protein